MTNDIMTALHSPGISQRRGFSSEPHGEEAKELADDEAEEKGNVPDTIAVPNDGLKAWLQVAGSFLMMSNTWWIDCWTDAYSPTICLRAKCHRIYRRMD